MRISIRAALTLLAAAFVACDASTEGEQRLDAAVAFDGETPSNDAETRADAGAETADAEPMDGADEAPLDAAEVDADVPSDATTMSDGAADAAALDGGLVFDAGDAQDAPQEHVLELQSFRLVLPAAALPGGATPTIEHLSVPAPQQLGPLSDVYQAKPAGALAAPATIAFTASRPDAVIYWWSEAAKVYRPLPTTLQAGYATAQVTELSRGFLGLALDCSEPGQRQCDDACVDVSTSETHCGACGRSCGAHELCRQGDCACAPGHVRCSGRCMSLAADESNCGACGEACGLGQLCWNNACRDVLGETCATPILIQDTASQDFSTELSAKLWNAAADMPVPLQLGAVLNTGADPAPVADLFWSYTSTQRRAMSIRPSIDLSTDLPEGFAIAVYRGGCGAAQLIASENGLVNFEAEAGVTYVIAAFQGAGRFGPLNNKEIRLSLQGSVDVGECLPPAHQCGDGCKSEEAWSSLHCGGCGQHCGLGMCNLGKCGCSAVAPDRCSGACVDLDIDPGNCGQCGHVCEEASLCLNGACQPKGRGISCADAIELENGKSVRFSMQGTQSDERWPQWCGKPGSLTTGRIFRYTATQRGRVGFTIGTFGYPRVALVELSPDSCETGNFATLPTCSDTISIESEVVGQVHYILVANMGERPAAGELSLAWVDANHDCHTAEPYRCGVQCVHPMTDEQHCGGCGRACASGQTCVSGECRNPPSQANACPDATPIPLQGFDLTTTLFEDMRGQTAQIALPRAVAHLVNRGSSRAPVRDRVWSLAAGDEDYSVVIDGAVLAPTASGMPLGGAMAVYRDECSSEFLLDVAPLSGRLSFYMRRGSTYYVVAFQGPRAFDDAPAYAHLALQASKLDYDPGCLGVGVTPCERSCAPMLSEVHCGGCGVGCGGGAVCVHDAINLGHCECRIEGKTLCDSGCVDLQTDPLHCGQCDRACAADSLCLNGSCRPAIQGLSCSTAIELGAVGSAQRFSMQGAAALQTWPLACGAEDSTTQARIFKLTGPQNTARSLRMLSEARGHVSLAELSAADCEQGEPLLACSRERPYQPAALSSNPPAGEVRYFAVTSASPDAPAGTVNLADYDPTLPDPDVSKPPSEICRGHWQPKQRAVDAGLVWSGPDWQKGAVVFDAAGNGLVLDVNKASMPEVISRHFSPQSGWSAESVVGSAWIPPMPSPKYTYPPSLHLAGDPNGIAFAVWLLHGQEGYTTFVNRYEHGVGWGTPLRLFNDPADSGRSYPNFAQVAAGAGYAHVLITNITHWSGVKGPWLRSYIPGSGWQPVQNFSDRESGSVFANRVGQALLFMDGGTTGWWSSQGVFEAPTRQAALSFAMDGVALTDAGHLLVLGGSAYGLIYSAKPPNDYWSRVSRARELAEPNGALAVRVLSDQAVLAIVRGAQTYGTCYTPGGGFSAFESISDVPPRSVLLQPMGARSVIARWMENAVEYVARYEW